MELWYNASSYYFILEYIEKKKNTLNMVLGEGGSNLYRNIYIYIWGVWGGAKGRFRDFYFFYIYFKVLSGDLSNNDQILKKKKKMGGFTPLGTWDFRKMTQNLKFWQFLTLSQYISGTVIWKGMLFWTFWHQSRFARPKIDFTGVIFVKKNLKFSEICHSKKGVLGPLQGGWGVKFGIFTIFSYMSMYYLVI